MCEFLPFYLFVLSPRLRLCGFEAKIDGKIYAGISYEYGKLNAMALGFLLSIDSICISNV